MDWGHFHRALIPQLTGLSPPIFFHSLSLFTSLKGSSSLSGPITTLHFTSGVLWPYCICVFSSPSRISAITVFELTSRALPIGDSITVPEALQTPFSFSFWDLRSFFCLVLREYTKSPFVLSIHIPIS
ncbi:uncharacterized protein MONOS_13283 [Monocercomonoides exilis]|uniref:uncharacterized protein n=1 Tax=Monocercomonoides exilis TaxID=2049356 RepID=UPI003559A3D7|nr:hypothetical protein MONOS_13283 [Monocercomonoides exilis]|eukprot:MONOS_13283.1-p1 / transcript=MONOS_13283.1 / gene=MONOS_13283 / organism=Monocercomonoides_exilis_PA203 / gene_product=unspecified product / transcript_product=unspecified product / location=Mono_scaffold00803:23873-24256(-) / protein_length=128 / sequence_SO=supercontig / SO=protein_coding / is_pseudo=false